MEVDRSAVEPGTPCGDDRGRDAPVPGLAWRDLADGGGLDRGARCCRPTAASRSSSITVTRPPRLPTPRHGAGTLMTYSVHTSQSGLAACLDRPGERDITSHVNLTLVQRAAERAGLRTLARVDQTYFLLGVGAAAWMTHDSGDAMADLKRRLALKTLLVPGGLGSTMKVLIFGAGVGDASRSPPPPGARV